MSKYKLISRKGKPSLKDKQIMREGMLSHHASQGHIRKDQDDSYSIVLKNENKITKGVIVASFRWRAMHIHTLWIDKSIRQLGWGSKLLDGVEQEAIKRGCYLSYTDTYSWQAPKFYEKHGYKLYGKLDDFPKGNCLSYYEKRLNQKIIL